MLIANGASEETLEVIRSTLTSRWPYPLTIDEAVASGASSWIFKVKRYPWTVSYGNKHLDKLIEGAKKQLAQYPQVPIPPPPAPKNDDGESAKSLLTYLVKVSQIWEIFFNDLLNVFVNDQHL